MPERMSNIQIVEEILNNPNAAKLRSAATQIAGIIFEARASSEFLNSNLDSEQKRRIETLLQEFREQALNVLGQDVSGIDDLYSQIINPVMTRLIERSA